MARTLIRSTWTPEEFRSACVGVLRQCNAALVIVTSYDGDPRGVAAARWLEKNGLIVRTMSGALRGDRPWIGFAVTDAGRVALSLVPREDR